MSTSFKGLLAASWVLPLLAFPGVALAQPAQVSPGSGAQAAASSAFTRSLLGPTARMLKPGEVHIDAVSIVAPVVQVGVASWLELGGGLWPGGAYWITPKVQVHRGERTSVAAGVVQAFAPGDDGGQLGVAYVVATREAGKGAWTYGGGVAYAHENDGDSGAVPVIQVGGERRVGRHVWLLSENYLVGPMGIVTTGIRAQGRHVSADFAVPIFIDETGAFPAVLVSVGFRFGG